MCLYNLKKLKNKSLPTDLNFEDHAIGNTHIFFWPNFDIQVMNAETLFTEFLIEHNIPLREELNYL